ncbi:MAG: metallophosphoesterase [Gammaproteobacteria bacterium]|nr:metallophosphoesterase [Gammaproteobacteria bacterium]
MNESSQTGGHANESFRFVQLSDLHLSSIDKPNPFNLLNKRSLGYLSWLRKRRYTHQRWILDLAIEEIRELNVDHYAITGDLTHIGLKDEFEQAHQWLNSVAPSDKITVIPGNHDLYVNEQWDRSFALWENYMLGDDQKKDELSKKALTQLNQLYPIVRIRKQIAFIGLSSVFDAPWFRATGKINTLQLNRLETLLRSKSLANYCKVVLIHHPLTITHTPERKCLLNRDKLTSLLQQYPVELVLHGHGHNSCYDSIKHTDNTETPIIGMSSSSSINQIKNYQAEFILFDIKKTSLGWHINKQSYTFNESLKKFIATTQQEFKQPRAC